jgi:hypothetical protein
MLRSRTVVQRVIDVLVVAVAIGLHQIVVDAGWRNRVTRLDSEMLLDHGRVDPLESGDLDLVHLRRLASGKLDVLRPGCIVGFADCQWTQAIGERFGCRDAPISRFRSALEVTGGDSFKVGLDVDVGWFEGGQRADDVLLRQDIDHLGRNAQQAADFICLQQRRTDVDGNRDVGLTARTRFVDRHVIDQATVHQLLSVDLDRRHQAGNRHAGAHRR